MGDGRTKRLADIRVGDVIYGTRRDGAYRRYTRTTVLDHWSVVKPAWRVRLQDGTELVTSGDHRFLTDRGWKHVDGEGRGPECRPHLTTNNQLLGTGGFADGPKEDEDYRAGYLCGMVRGDATGCDEEALDRSQRYLTDLGTAVDEIERVTRWPDDPPLSWHTGFLAGLFDAEGGRNVGVLRISSGDIETIRRTVAAFDRLGFRVVVEQVRGRPMMDVRLPGGLVEHLRFFHTVDPAVSRTLDIEGHAVETDARLRVMSIEPLGMDLPLYDLTTGTGDYIADGVISHNCFARPTHDYLGLDIDEGFERQIVVKVNAVDRLRAELDPRRWKGEAIAMGTNTDPYQRCEGKYHLTRGLVEVLSAARNPFSILTKSTLILRDAELLAEAARRTDVHVNFSIGTLDREVWKATEPGTPAPERRVEAVAKLREAGVPCGVLVAPILPGLSDSPEQLQAVVAACADAGAANISGGMVLYLKPGVREVFLGHLARTHPELVPRYEAMYTGVRAPRAVQERVTRITREALARRRGTHVVVRGGRRPSGPPPSPPVAPTAPLAQQLGLGL
jgi:DNA repair photolyase